MEMMTAWSAAVLVGAVMVIKNRAQSCADESPAATCDFLCFLCSQEIHTFSILHRDTFL